MTVDRLPDRVVHNRLDRVLHLSCVRHLLRQHDDRQIVLDCSVTADCIGVDFELRKGAVITGRVVDNDIDTDRTSRTQHRIGGMRSRCKEPVVDRALGHR